MNRVRTTARRLWIAALLLAFVAPARADSWREAMDAAGAELGRRRPEADALAAAREALAARPREGLDEDEWVDLHVMLAALDRRRDPMPPYPGPAIDVARYSAAIGADPVPDAIALLDAAARIRAIRPTPGAPPADAGDRTRLFDASRRAAATAARALRLATDPDPLVAAAARVLSDAARDFSFDLRCYGLGKTHEGRERFEWRLAHHHGLDIDAAETRRRGEAAVRRSLAALEALAREIDPRLTWRELTERGRNEHPADSAGLLESCRRATADAARITEASGRVTVPPGAGEPGVKLVEHLVPVFPTPFAAYHRGRWRGERYDGAVAIAAVPAGRPDTEAILRERGRHWMRVVCAHEGVPGHHLQFAVAARTKSPFRHLGYNSAYVEGWGLYSEGLSERMGIFPDPLTRLARLRMRLWRAVRVVVDVGLGTGEMTPSEAVRLLTDVVLLTRSSAEYEVTRYLGTPTQPLSYLLGAKKIEAMHRAWLVRHGADSEREFHDRFLRLGPIPLPLAAAVLLDRRAAYDAAHP